MSHKCGACLITCEDFRLHQRRDGRNYVAEFIKNLNLDCDLITRGGSIQDIVRPESEGFLESLFRDAEVSSKLHCADTIFLLNHEDCGAYGGFTFSTREEEIEKHTIDLKEAKKILSKNFPNKKIKLFFAELETGASDVFLINEVSLNCL